MSGPISPIEGYYIESDGGFFFAVKGLVHPPKAVVAYLRYAPDTNGERERKGIHYRRLYYFEEQEKLLQERCPTCLFFDPVFGERLQGVPRERIRQVYDPCFKLEELRSRENLDEVEKSALDFGEILRDRAGVSKRCLGISGSILLELHTPQSDIDIIVYGADNCWAVHKALETMLDEPSTRVERLNRKELEELYTFRSQDTPMNFEDFAWQERRKVIQGRFWGYNYFIRFVRVPSEGRESYGDRKCTSLGWAEVEATGTDASEAIFTPCVYKIDDVQFVAAQAVPTMPPREIVSFRGRFCEQAKEGERILARGKIERVVTREGEAYHRLLLGRPGDFMVVK